MEKQQLSNNKVEEIVDPELKYVAVRLIECLCIAIFVFGLLWNTTEVLKLTTPQFMMLYGGGGAVLSEMLARFFSKKKPENKEM